MMMYQQMDSPKYKHIPFCNMGDGTPCASSIVISRYNQDTLRLLTPMHRHYIFQINYVVKGNLLHIINNTAYPLVAGDIFIIPPYIPHQIKSIANSEYDIIELEFVPEEVFGEDWLSAASSGKSNALYDFSYIKPFFVNESRVRPRLNLTGKDQLVVESILKDMLSEFQKKHNQFQLALKADLFKLLVIAGRNREEDLPPAKGPQLMDHHRDAMLQTLDYIDQHWDEKITIDDAARVAMMSQSYFSYLFKLMTKKTFVEYLHDIRLKKAMILLKTTDDQILSICYSCGFSSINYFNRIFKKAVGVTPRLYRQASRTIKLP